MQDSKSARHARSVGRGVGQVERRGVRRPAAHREQLEHRIELADRLRQVALVDGVLEPVALGQRIRRQLDADAQVAAPVARRDPHADVRLGAAQLGLARRGSVERGQLVAEALQVGGVEDRPAGGDDRAGLRALRGHVQPVAVPAIVRVGELPAVDPDLEAPELDRRRLDGCAG